MEELIKCIERLFPYNWKTNTNKRVVTIEVSEDEMNNYNPIVKFFENQKDIIPLIQNTEGIDLHQKPKFTKLQVPTGLEIILKIKE